MYKLIASDLDETLLDDHKQISTKSLDAIHKARELGIKFVPSTGRGVTLVQNVLLSLEPNEPIYIRYPFWILVFLCQYFILFTCSILQYCTSCGILRVLEVCHVPKTNHD